MSCFGHSWRSGAGAAKLLGGLQSQFVLREALLLMSWDLVLHEAWLPHQQGKLQAVDVS
jgi:hypothetical protein